MAGPHLSPAGATPAFYCAGSVSQRRRCWNGLLALLAAEQWAVIENLTVLNDRHDFFRQEVLQKRALPYFAFRYRRLSVM